MVAATPGAKGTDVNEKVGLLKATGTVTKILKYSWVAVVTPAVAKKTGLYEAIPVGLTTASLVKTTEVIKGVWAGATEPLLCKRSIAMSNCKTSCVVEAVEAIQK